MVDTEVVVAGSSPGAFLFWIPMSASIAQSEACGRTIRVAETTAGASRSERLDRCQRRRACCRHGTPEERALEPQLLVMDVDRLPKHGMALRVDEWFSVVRNGNFLPFDDWLPIVAMPVQSAVAGMRLPQGNVAFELRHGKQYAIEDSAHGARTFQCIIDGRVPLVAFIDEPGYRGPWITVRNLFTIEEMVSMRELRE